MPKDKMKSKRTMIWSLSAVIAVAVLVAGFFLVKTLISDDGGKRKRQIRMVTLLKPPPPPPVKKKPPEPKKKKEVIEPEKKDVPEQTEEQADDTPPGEQLGLDADGSAGSDGFGLVAKKGGRSLIGGGLGESSLLRKFAWYTQILQEEIREKVNKVLEKNGGIPKGSLKTYVKIVLDSTGKVTDFEIYGSSGNHEMDEAVHIALRSTLISEPPPDGMPKSMKIKITSKG
jgi:TonB family protein